MRTDFRTSSNHVKQFGIAIIVASVLLPMIQTTARSDSAPTVTILSADQSKRAVVSVELADTADKRERGLMYRKHLDDKAGMLFIFPVAENAQFWMKNTEIPLDMIFADRSGRVIGIVANARPFSENLLGGFIGTSYVLEVNGGFAAKHAIMVGDRLDIH